MSLSRRLFALSAIGALLLPVMAKAATAAGQQIGAHSPFLSIEGRAAEWGDHNVRIGFPGVTLRLRFHGRRLVLGSIALSATQWVDVTVDGGAAQKVWLDPKTDSLVAFDGADGEHVIEIARRNESWQGAWDVSGATTDGRFLPPPDLPAKKLMFIGDSITCGTGTDVTSDDLRQDNDTSDAQKTYARLLARRLNTQCHLVSYGGRGVIRDWQGIRATNNAPQFYELAAPDEPHALWRPSNYVPNVIGIMLGTNDFSQGIPDQNEFTNAYVQFLEKIQRDAPKAAIILMDSPILTDDGLPKRTVLGAYVDEVIRRVNSPLVSHAPVGHYPGRAVNAHPIGEEHIAMANALEPLFRKALAI